MIKLQLFKRAFIVYFVSYNLIIFKLSQILIILDIKDIARAV